MPESVCADDTLVLRLAEARGRTDDVFARIRRHALYDRPIPERHRLIFYLGHVEAFDWNLIAGQVLRREAFHPRFDNLFAFGIDPVDGGLPTDQPEDWPPEDEIRAYNAEARSRLDRMLPEVASPFLHVAIEHRLMHAETLAYLLHQVPLDKKIAPPLEKVVTGPTHAPRMEDIPAGTATIGRPRRDDVFGWDNEFEEVRAPVPAFRADAFPVTNAEFLRFVEAKGYARQELWRAEDWAWVRQSDRTHPHFWLKRDAEWTLRGMFGDRLLPADEPVYVSYAEAWAYARWIGKILPTEAQWHRMAYGTQGGQERSYPWGEDLPDVRHGNFDFARWDATPVQAHPAGTSAFGVADLIGNGWEWTRTPFGPLPGFRAFDCYPGYSANFFDGKHFVLKGGSPRTAACLLRRPFRNWFQPHYPYLYAKFRCVNE